MDYYPHKWLLVQIEHPSGPVFKVFASFYGGFADGDSWKLNSGITHIEDAGGYYRFHGWTGSVYICNKGNYGASMYGGRVLNDLEDESQGKLKHIPTLEEAMTAVQHLMKS